MLHLLLLFAIVLVPAPILAQTTQVLFLAPIDGTGTDADPRIAHGLLTTPGMGCIDLQTANRAICAADSYPAGVVQLSRLIDRLTPAKKLALETALGITLSTDDPLGIIAELLLIHARTDGTRWRPLKAERDGTYKIYLGKKDPAWRQTAWLYPYWYDNGLVADAWNGTKDAVAIAYHYTLEPAVAWATTLATENFTGTDGDLTGRTFVHPWTEFNSTGWTVASNQAVVSASGTSNEARADAALATGDMSIQATLVSISGAGTGAARCGVIGRKENNATRTFFMMNGDAAPGGTANFHTSKLVAGTRTTVASTNSTINANDVILLNLNGSTITGYVNGSVKVGPTTDTESMAGTYGGIATSVSATSVTCTLDDWLAFDNPTVFGPLQRRTF